MFESVVTRRMRSNQRGFSMVELLIVVTIILVISAFAIPNVVVTLESYRLRTSGSMLVSKLMDARINAIKRNRPAWIVIDLAAATVQAQIAGIGDFGAPGRLEGGVAFAAPTPVQITFDSLGRPTNVPSAPPHTVRLQVIRSGQQSNVVVSPTGRITVN